MAQPELARLHPNVISTFARDRHRDQSLGTIFGLTAFIACCVALIAGIGLTSVPVALVIAAVPTAVAAGLVGVGRLGYRDADQYVVDAINAVESDVNEHAPDEVRARATAIRAAAYAALRELHAAEDAHRRLAREQHRAFTLGDHMRYKSSPCGSASLARDSSDMAYPELWDAIAPQRAKMVMRLEAADTKLRLVVEEALTLAKIGRKYTAEFGTPNYDFLLKARKAAALAPSKAMLAERLQAARLELELTDEIDKIPAINR